MSLLWLCSWTNCGVYGRHVNDARDHEILILTLQALFGSDRLANLVQWLAFVGALVAVSGISRALGAGKHARLAGIGFAAVVPMAVLQATSTQNDLVEAFWLLAFAYFVVLGQLRSLSTAECVATGLALGMSILTKTTLYVYGLPFLVLLAVSGWKENRHAPLRQLTIILGLAALLNLPIWWRNQTRLELRFGPLAVLMDQRSSTGRHLHDAHGPIRQARQ